MTTVQLEFARDDEAALTTVKSLNDGSLVATPDRFDGGVEIATAIIELTTVSVPVVAMLIRENLRTKRHIKVKMKGVEISGADLKDAERFLKSVAE